VEYRKVTRPPLVAVRAMIQSPFVDEPYVIYAAGFDAGDAYTPHARKHNTGGLYRSVFLVP